jgi:hypothetical protein
MTYGRRRLPQVVCVRLRAPYQICCISGVSFGVLKIAGPAHATVLDYFCPAACRNILVTGQVVCGCEAPLPGRRSLVGDQRAEAPCHADDGPPSGVRPWSVSSAWGALADGIGAHDPAWVLQRRPTVLDRPCLAAPIQAGVVMTQQDGCFGAASVGRLAERRAQTLCRSTPGTSVCNCNDQFHERPIDAGRPAPDFRCRPGSRRCNP